MPYVLKPVLIVVLVLTPILSEKRLLVTGIIVVFVQLFQIPTFCRIIYLKFANLAAVFFIVGTSTSASVLVPKFSVIILIIRPGKNQTTSAFQNRILYYRYPNSQMASS